MENITQSEIYPGGDLWVRMERNHEIIQKLSLKLSGYTYEPKCAKHFEKYNALRANFKAFGEHQKALWNKMSQKEDFRDGEVERELHLQLDRYRQLESDIADYLLDMGERP